MKDQTPEMTLRDYFAAKVMAAYAASAAWNYETNLELACSASYAYADAMLKARVGLPVAVTTRGIDCLQLTVRAKNILRSENIKTVEQLILLTGNDLLKIPNLGRTSLQDIKTQLARLNLRLKGKHGTA